MKGEAAQNKNEEKRSIKNTLEKLREAICCMFQKVKKEKKNDNNKNKCEIRMLRSFHIQLLFPSQLFAFMYLWWKKEKVKILGTSTTTKKNKRAIFFQINFKCKFTLFVSFRFLLSTVWPIRLNGEYHFLVPVK